MVLSLTPISLAIVAAYVVNTAVTYAGGVYGAFGHTNSHQSAAYPTLVTPAGWTFSIWGFIFIGEGVFMVAALCSGGASVPEKEEIRTIFPYFVSACLCQALWTIVFAQPLSSGGEATWAVWASLVIMVALWVSLYVLLWLQAGLLSDEPRPSWRRWALFHLPFQLHAGWAPRPG